MGTPIPGSEKDEILDEIRDIYLCSQRYRDAKYSKTNTVDPMRLFEKTKYYKVRFTEVIDLISRRNVFVKKGFAYVPHTDLIAILLSRFRSNLSHKLTIAFRALPYVNRDERVRPLLKKLQHAYLGPSYGTQSNTAQVGAVTAYTVDSYKDSFPMCMREMHAYLKKHHKLKYEGRVQLRLFLKGIGLSMQDSLEYFRTEFCKHPEITPDKFQKEYTYNIRHAYGQEGKRANYPAKPCMALIKGVQPNNDQCHGCPYKYMNSMTMRNKLRAQGLNSTDVDTIIAEMEKPNNYQKACTAHFIAQHKGEEPPQVFEHPNAWYLASVQYYKEKSKNSKPSQEETSQTSIPSQQ